MDRTRLSRSLLMKSLWGEDLHQRAVAPSFDGVGKFPNQTKTNMASFAPPADPHHEPVMVREVLQLLDPKPGAVVVDATLGYGGHAGAIAHRIGPGGLLVGLDLDPEAIEASQAKAREWPCRTEFVQTGYDDLGLVLDRLGIGGINGIVVDLGVASPQIDCPGRGFSFQQEGPLDMRMDPESSPSAAEWLATAEEKDIRRTLLRYGEEKRAVSIAKAIVKERGLGPIETTAQLVDIVGSCFPDRVRAGRVHPATRTFQALRVLVNDESKRLERLLSYLPARLLPDARLVFLAYESLADRMIKKSLLDWTGKNDPVLSRVPIRGEWEGLVKILTPKVVRPSEEEVIRNRRARSARLRAAERTRRPFR